VLSGFTATESLLVGTLGSPERMRGWIFALLGGAVPGSEQVIDFIRWDGIGQ
jgi:hypothetical protein